MRSVLVLVLVFLSAAPAWAQTGVVGRTLSIGGSPNVPSDSSVRLEDLATTGGTEVLLIDTTTLGVRRRLLGKSDLPSVVGYTDEAETWSLLQTFTSGLTSNGLVTIGGANDLLLGTGGIRVPSGSVLFRNIADSATTASIGDSAIALNQPTTVTGSLTVTGDVIAPTIRAASSPFSVMNTTNVAAIAQFANTSVSLNQNTSVTGTFGATGNATFSLDVAVNGGDLTSTASNLNIAPASTLTLDADVRMPSAHTIGTDNFASRTTGWRIDYAGAADFRYTYADEFYTKNFIADLETALNGGQIIAKSTVILAQNFTCPAAAGTATLWVRDFPGHGNMRVFAASDWIVLRTMTRADADNDGNIEFSIGDCVGQVSAYADGTAGNDGTQSWTFTRGSGGNAGAMSASTVINADAVVIDYGVSGQGVLVARANDGIEGANSPYWQVATWTTSPVAANFSLRTRWGQLNGAYGYSASTYGLCAGDAADVFLCADPTNGVRIMEAGTNQKFIAHPTGYVQVGESGTGEHNLYLDNTQIALRIATTDWVNLSASGSVFGRVGSGLQNLLIDASGNAIFRLNTAQRMRLDTTGYALIGDASGTNANTFISDTQVALRRGTTDYINLSASGLLVGQATSGQGNVFVDTSGNINLRTGATTKLAMSGSTGNITSTGSITLSTGGMIESTGNFELSQSSGLWLQPEAGSTFSAGRTIKFGTSVVAPSATIGMWNDNALRLSVPGVAAGAGIRLNVGTGIFGINANNGFNLTYEQGVGVNDRVINAVFQGHHDAVAGNTTVQIVPNLSGLVGSTRTSQIGSSTNPWDRVYGSQFYAGSTPGFSGACSAASFTVVGGIITSC